MKGLTTTTKPKRREWTMGPIVYLLFGPIIWMLHFTTIYAVQSTLCALGAPARTLLNVDFVQLAVFIATALALVTLAGAMWRLIPVLRKPGSADQLASSQFFEAAMKVLCLLAAIGIIWTGLAAFVLHPCAALR